MIKKKKFNFETSLIFCRNANDWKILHFKTFNFLLNFANEPASTTVEWWMKRAPVTNKQKILRTWKKKLFRCREKKRNRKKLYFFASTTSFIENVKKKTIGERVLCRSFKDLRTNCSARNFWIYDWNLMRYRLPIALPSELRPECEFKILELWHHARNFPKD